MKKYILTMLVLSVLSLLHAMNLKDPSEQLSNAVLADDIEEARSAIKQGANAQSTFHGSFDTMLHGAKSAAMAQLLIDYGADIKANSWAGYTPLGKMLYRPNNPNIHAIETLLRNGASLVKTNPAGRTPFKSMQDEIKMAIERKMNKETIEHYKVIADVLKNYPRLVAEAKAEPQNTIQQAVNLGLVDLTKQILKTLRLSDKELQDLAEIAKKQYALTQDSSYKEIGNLLRFKLGLTGTALGVSTKGVLGYSLPKDVIAIIKQQ
ncbi:hypothetical protein H0X48_05105 [Candidatus Dependentiae bacterium]|nr:hypothetical protein [Candidatus Dependentiae bacterium]